MIKADCNVSTSILEKVNNNIYLILEFFMDICKGSEYELLDEIFPVHYLRKKKEKCIEVIDELKDYSIDAYFHDLNPVQKFALFHLIEWWEDVSTYEFDEKVDVKEIKSDDDRYIAENINDIEYYKSLMFSDWDFLEESLSNDIELYKIYGPAYEDYKDINIEDYIELVPDDIKKEYYQAKNKFKLLNENYKNEMIDTEHLIIKQIYNAIKLRENNPRRLFSTSETQLSDDIVDIVKETLYKNKIIIEREKPSGFAKIGIGECDFYIYTYQDGIYRDIAIGENKEWGNFENQLKQLIGYMSKDIQFGFTILFNKNGKVDTVLQKRIEILKKFYIEKDGIKFFQVMKGCVYEHKEMNDVLLTFHENPEKKGTYFKLYHFLINANLVEREESALQARNKNT